MVRLPEVNNDLVIRSVPACQHVTVYLRGGYQVVSVSCLDCGRRYTVDNSTGIAEVTGAEL